MKSAINFFSYSRTDAEFTLKLANDLRQSGASIWLDQIDIVAGSHWDSSVEAALIAASRLIVILSPVAVASANVMDEVSYALQNGKTVIPIIFKPCNIPLRLTRLQQIDFTNNYKIGLNQLIKVLEISNTIVTANVTKIKNDLQEYDEKNKEQSEKIKTHSAGETKWELIWKKNNKKILVGLGIILLLFVGWRINQAGYNNDREMFANEAETIQTATPAYDTSNNSTATNTGLTEIKKDITDDVIPLPVSADINFDTNTYYRLTTAWQEAGKSMQVKTANSKFIPVELAATSNDATQAWKIIALSNGYFRFVSKAYGHAMSIDLVEDEDHFATQLAASGYFQGQLWNITPLALKGHFKLTSWWKGTNMALDVRNDGDNNILQLTPFVGAAGQKWLIQPFNTH